MDTKTFVIAIAMLIIGFGAAKLGSPQPQIPEGMHVMPDGTLMSNDGSMTHEMDAMTARLVGQSGDAFDRIFVEDMIVHHQGAVDMARMALESAGREEVKSLSREIIEAQEREIAVMRGWLEAWYGR